MHPKTLPSHETKIYLNSAIFKDNEEFDYVRSYYHNKTMGFPIYMHRHNFYEINTHYEEAGGVDSLEKKAEFVSSCIEAYKVRHAMKGADAVNMFEKEGVLDYLIDGYDVLHTQSLEYVIDEIELYLKKRGAVR